MESSSLMNDASKEPKENLLDSINSKYILGRILKYLKENVALKIIKYNKKIQSRFNISINTYKNFIILTPIEIEIMPIKGQYGKFINYPSDEEKSYFHIYFNNSKEIIKRNYLNKSDNIKDITIKVIIDYNVKSFSGLFKYCKNIESINFKKFHRNNITSMKNMFYQCSSLKVLNLSNFRTDNVIDMSGMFTECSSLEELNLSKFKTDKVIDMSEMFIDCSSLKKLNLSNFNTSNVTNMHGMFCGYLDALH